MPIDMMQKICSIIGNTKNDLGVDCISRQAVLELIADYDLSMGQVVRGIHALPSVTPQEPKTGHWDLTDVEGNKVWHCRCSECGKDPQDYISGSEDWWLIKNKLPKFCPSCGSDNREVVEE